MGWLFRPLVAVLAIGLLFPPPLRAQDTVRVVEAVDGDTLLVQSGEESLAVRLIGIDAPERSHPSKPKEFLADEAASFLASLCEGKTVRMEAGDEDADRHGRLLRYVFLPDGTLVNREMVRQGYARVYRRFRFAREAELSEAEEEARKGEKGIWREKGMAEVRWLQRNGAHPISVLPLSGDRYAVVFGGMVKTGVPPERLANTVQNVLRWRSENSDREFENAARKGGFVPLSAARERADSAAAAVSPPPPNGSPSGKVMSWEDAHRAVGEEVVVEGTLVRAHRSKSALYLNFHPNWKKYVTVVILDKDLPRFPKDAKAYYKGKTVRVRGEVTLYNGRPEIVVRSPDAITILK